MRRRQQVKQHADRIMPAERRKIKGDEGRAAAATSKELACHFKGTPLYSNHSSSTVLGAEARKYSRAASK